jgi:ribosomal protein S15P/S13E
MEVTYKRLVKNLHSELNTCRTNESNLHIDIQRQNNEIDHLTSALNNMREHLQQTIKKNDSMCHLLDVEAEQRQKIKVSY